MGNKSSQQSSTQIVQQVPTGPTTTVVRLSDGRAAIAYPAHDPKGRQYYEGDFKDGKRCGKGMLRWRNGVVYEGEWSEDNMHGRLGKMTWPEGLVYEGEWSEGQMEGVGIMKRTQSCLNRKKKSTYAYQGEWKNGRRHGLGKQIFEEGDPEGRVSYEGEWRDGLRQGNGMMLWRDGSFYAGSWSKGVREGHGIFVDMGRNCDRYEGNWHKDMREDPEGFVTDRYLNTYRGVFVKDVKHGNGVFTFHHGRVRREVWVWGQRVSDGIPVIPGTTPQAVSVPSQITPEELPSLVVLCLEALGQNKKLCRTLGTWREPKILHEKTASKGTHVRSLCIALTMLHQQRVMDQESKPSETALLPQELLSKFRSFVACREAGMVA